jgi:hypothetical protein
MYVSGTEPECCSVPDTYMYVTAFRFSVEHVDVGYSIPVTYM